MNVQNLLLKKPIKIIPSTLHVTLVLVKQFIKVMDKMKPVLKYLHGSFLDWVKKKKRVGFCGSSDQTVLPEIEI